MLEKVMSDQPVQPGETVLTSGGDRIFPKGIAIGTVSKISQGPELFLNIRVKPAANLNKLEEVLIVTQLEEREITPSQAGPLRAVDILAQRLPSVPEKPPAENGKPDKNSTKSPAGTAPQTHAAGTVTPPASGGVATSPKPPSVTGTPAKAASTASSGTAAKKVPENTNATQSPDGVPEPVSHNAPASAASAIVKPTNVQKPVLPVLKLSDRISNPAVSGKAKTESAGVDQRKPDRAAQVKAGQPTSDQAQSPTSKPDQPSIDQSKPEQSPPQNRRL